MKSLSEITNSNDWVGLGIAGNQAEHLDQAGEAEDFKDVVALENAPKGMFPWFVSGHDSFLKINPLSSSEIKLKGDDPLQPEPEIGLVVEFDYADSATDGQVLAGLKVLGFTAFNDCSRRVAADKISHKKNWGAASQGIADTILPLDDFTEVGGYIENYRLVCYLQRDGELIQYGCDTAVADYCYFNQQLVDWIVNQINTQKDQGPLEPIGAMLANSKPNYGVIGIGATCYTAFGNSEERFLKEGDVVSVVVYDARTQDIEAVESVISGNVAQPNDNTMIVLKQCAVL